MTPTAVATLTLTDALHARPALAVQLGEFAWEDAVTIARDPRREVIEAQNSIWLVTCLPQVFGLIGREEPSLAAECRWIVAMMRAYTNHIQHQEFVLIRPDTWEEARGEW